MIRDRRDSGLVYTSFAPWTMGIDRPFPEAAALAAEHGFDAIQVDLGYLDEHGPEAYRAVLDEHALRNGTVGLPVDVEADEAEYEADLDRLEEVAEAVAAVGCDRCSTYVVSFSDERTYDERFEFLAERFRRPAEILDDHGIRLGLEFLGPETLRAGHEYEFVHDAAGMLELCEAIDAGDVGLLLDSWHWYTSGDDTETIRGLSGEDVVEVHLNDAPEGRARAEQVDDDRRLPAATGVIDVAGFLGALETIGYDGPVMVEPFSDEVEAMTDDEAAAATARALAESFELAGL